MRLWSVAFYVQVWIVEFIFKRTPSENHQGTLEQGSARPNAHTGLSSHAAGIGFSILLVTPKRDQEIKKESVKVLTWIFTASFFNLIPQKASRWQQCGRDRLTDHPSAADGHQVIKGLKHVWEGQPPVHNHSYNCNVKTKEPCKQLREKFTEN